MNTEKIIERQKESNKRLSDRVKFQKALIVNKDLEIERLNQMLCDVNKFTQALFAGEDEDKPSILLEKVKIKKINGHEDFSIKITFTTPSGAKIVTTDNCIVGAFKDLRFELVSRTRELNELCDAIGVD